MEVKIILPQKGPAKVYYKNIRKSFDQLIKIDPLMNPDKYKAMLLQIDHSIQNLKKAEPEFDCMSLEKEYNFYYLQLIGS